MMEQKEKILTLRPMDIMCGRGRASHFHNGNVYFRSVVACHLPKYSSKDTPRCEKSEIVISVIQECFRQGSRFVKKNKDGNGWKELDLSEIKLKVGHALRDACSGMTKSLKHLSTPKTPSEFSEEVALQATMLEPRMMDPGERKLAAKRRQKSRMIGRDSRRPSREFLTLAVNGQQSDALYLPLTERSELRAQQTLSAGQQHSDNLTISQQQHQLHVAPSPPMPLNMQDSCIFSKDQQPDPMPQVLNQALAQMSPETYQQLQLLHANGDSFVTLLKKLSDCKGTAGCSTPL